MVAGEYSVLGPSGEALALAVTPGLEVLATPSSRWGLQRRDTGETWVDPAPPPAGLRFAHAALAAVRAEHPDTPPHSLTTRTLGDVGTGERKPGVGGSASAAVGAVAAALLAAGRTIGPEEVCRLALAAHLGAQGGRGSGYDVATIAYGGLVRWRPLRIAGDARVTTGEAERLDWPSSLHMLAGYTGRSASTTRLLEGLEQRAAADRLATARGLIELGRPVAALGDAFLSGDIDEVLSGIRACHRALVAWPDGRALGVVTPEVEAMIQIADSTGAAAKVSGAGGGDSVLAFAPNASILQATAAAWRAVGFAPLPLIYSVRGVAASDLSEIGFEALDSSE